MADFLPVTSGTPPNKWPTVSASWINGITKMYNWWRRSVESGESNSNFNPLESTTGLVKIKNLTSSDLLRGHYVQLGDYLLDDIDHRKHWFEGNLYDAAKSNKIAILTKAIKNDDTSFHAARILGRCTALVNVTDITHEFAAPDDGTYVFKSAASGDIPILSANKIDGTGVQELSVLLGSAPSSDTSTLRKFFVTTAIPAATGDSASITPDFGYGREAVTDVTTKAISPGSDGDPIKLWNYDTEKGYDAPGLVWVQSIHVSDGLASVDFLEAVVGLCNPLASG